MDAAFYTHPGFAGLAGRQRQNLGKRDKLLIEPVEGLQRHDEITVGIIRPVCHVLADAGRSLLKARDRIAQRRSSRNQERRNFIYNFRSRYVRLRNNHHDSFPITCSIFCRRISAVNGLIRYLLAPAWAACTTSSRSPRPVKRMNGTLRAAGCPRTARSSASPSISGML